MYHRIKKIPLLCCIFVIAFVIITCYLKIVDNKLDNIIETISNSEEFIQIDMAEENQEENVQEDIGEDIIGKIMIPKISLVANIKEGTQKEIIDNYVGHFENTSKNEGNIGLAAHNRGNKVKAYFAYIKNLQENDIIIYKTNEFERTYLVKTIKIIKDTDFSYLEPTQDNTITLITCVNNNPNYRLCVQAVEKK